MNDASLSAFIHRLPKTESHLHIEGALPYSLLQHLDPAQFAAPQACWAADFKWGSFEDFEAHLIEHALLWFTSAERYHEAANLIFKQHLEQNVRYVETSFHAGMIEYTGVPGPEILAAIRSALALPKLEARRLNDNLHRAEQWRDRLLAEGDLGLNALLQEFPAGDRQTLRQLMRQAEAEVERQQPPAAARQLFQRLRELLDTKA